LTVLGAVSLGLVTADAGERRALAVVRVRQSIDLKWPKLDGREARLQLRVAAWVAGTATDVEGATVDFDAFVGERFGDFGQR
jgi:hypothetical protein